MSHPDSAGTVTKVETVRGNSSASRVYVDEVPVGALPVDVAAELDLKRGRRLTPAEQSRLRAEVDAYSAIRKALQLLAYRPRTRSELEMRLRKAGRSAEAIGRALARCEHLGYIDDEAFARSFVRDRLRLKPRSRRALELELVRKGVERAIAVRAVEDGFAVTATEESALARRLAERRARALEGLERSTATRRLVAYLARRGFPHGTARRVVTEVLDAAPAPASSPDLD